MSTDKYLEMMKQLGKEPIESEIPTDWYDLPEIAQEAINIYNLLPSKIMPELGYTGKSYESLSILLEVYEIENKGLVIEIIHFIDQKAIIKASEELKREHDKAKAKAKHK